LGSADLRPGLLWVIELQPGSWAVDDLDKLRELERQIEQEWWWLNGALHAIAQVNSGDPGAYWQMLTQKRAVDRKRVEIASCIAAIVGSTKAC
jgi:hypothetical protein